MEKKTKKRGFVFLPSYLEAIHELPPDLRLEVYEGLCYYGINEEMPEDLSPVVRGFLRLMMPCVDAGKRRYQASVENGRLGGRPSKQKETRNNLEKPETEQEEPNGNKEKEKEIEIDIEIEKDNKKEKEKEKEKGVSRSDGPDWEAIDRENARRFKDPAMLLHPKPGELEQLVT